MIEFIISGNWNNDDRLAIGVGLSATFRRVLVQAEPSPEALEVAKNAVWGALVITPCPPGLPCFDSIEEAVDHSETLLTPVGYRGPPPDPAPRRISSFNKHYLKPYRWASKGEPMAIGHPLLPTLACLYTTLKTVEGVPIVVSDVRIKPTASTSPDYMVIPTWHMPSEIAEIIDIYLPPLKASAIALGILIGGYSAGPVIAIVKRRDNIVEEVAKRGGYAILLDETGNPCDLFKKRVVGHGAGNRQLRVYPDLCDKCGECLKSACPAIRPSAAGIPEILPQCTGCTACAILCTRGAIR